MAKSVLTWSDVNVDTFSKPLAKLYNDYKAKQAIAAEAGQSFTEALSKALEASKRVPAGKVPVISLRFGKVAVAFDDQTVRRSKGGTIEL